MSKHAVMPLTDYVNVCDTLREKIGTTEPIKSGDIPKKVNDVYDMGKLATLKDSRYMNGKESGTIVSVSDVTPIEHNVGVKVASKNLLAIDAIIPQNNVYISNGIISQIDSDTYNSPLVKLLSYNNNDYVGTIKTTPVQLGIISFVFTKDNTFNRLVFGLNGSVIDTIVSIDLSTFQDGDYVIQSNFTNITQGSVSWQDMQVEVGTTATSYTPYVEDLTGVEVARYERNLFNPIYSNYTQNRFYSYKYVGNAIMRMSFTDKDTTVDVNGIQVGFVVDINNVQGGANWAVKNGVIQANNSNVSTSDNSTLCPYIVIYPNTEDAFNRITARYDIQVEIGTVTEYEPYKEPIIYTTNADGTVEGVKSISPNMTLIPNNNAVTVECEYLRDIDLYIDNLITNVALTGGV